MDSPGLSLVYKCEEGRRPRHLISSSKPPSYNPLPLALRKFASASIVIAPSRNNIEQEVLLLLADEYRPTCAISMTNPGSLTMGFTEADPRQLASSMGTTQVGITISVVPSPASRDSRTRTRSSALVELKFT